MESIRFYDFNFQPVWDIQFVISANWQLYYNDIGTFELHTDIQDALTRVLQTHPYLVAVQGDKQAIITSRQFEGSECVLYGRTCNWLLTRRLTLAFEAKTDNVETVCRSFVSDAFADTPEVVLGTAAGIETQLAFEQKSDTTTFDAVQEALDKVKAGHRLRFDPHGKKWIFEVLTGKTLPLILSEDNRNAYESAYTENFLDYYSGGWYEAEQAENADGHRPDPVRTYLSGDESKTGIYRWECALSGDTQEAAKSDLQKQKWVKSVTAKLRGVHFGTDYSLGDSLQFKMQAGGYFLSDTKRVEGIHIWYEAQEIGEEPILS